MIKYDIYKNHCSFKFWWINWFCKTTWPVNGLINFFYLDSHIANIKGALIYIYSCFIKNVLQIEDKGI